MSGAPGAASGGAGRIEAVAIETVLEDAELALRWLPGRSRRLVVVFTGIGEAFGGEAPAEFAGSASDGGANNVLFVTDRMGSWYAMPGLWRRIVKLVRYLRRTEAIDEIVTLGNSMGGFGALLLPRDLRVTRAIAFAPQVSMAGGVAGDARWPDVEARFGALPAESVAGIVAGTRTQYYLTAGGACPADVAHLALMPDLARVNRWVLPGGRHNVALGLKRAGLLAPVVAAMLRGRRAGVDVLYGRYAEAVG